MPERVSARGVLDDLLRRGETSRERVRDVTLPATRIDGYPFRDAGTLASFHEILQQAERSGAVELEWRRFYEGQELKRIRLCDAPALARFLGRPLLLERVERAFSDLDTEGLPPWMGEALEALRKSWLKGSSRFGLKIDDASKLPALLAAVRALEALSPETALDYRQFGARYLGDSKLTSALAAPLAALYRPRIGPQLNAREILAQLNLVPLAQPVLLRGPLRLSDGQQSVSANVRPHIGVPISFLHEFALTQNPAYVLTIENQSSFNEYTGVVNDEGIVIYTAGLPTRALQEFYWLLTAASDAPLFHWGDTDVGGFRILKCLQGATDRPIRPHLMDGEGGFAYSTAQLSELKCIIPVNDYVDALIQRFVDHGYGLLEQETVQARAVPS